MFCSSWKPKIVVLSDLWIASSCLPPPQNTLKLKEKTRVSLMCLSSLLFFYWRILHLKSLWIVLLFLELRYSVLLLFCGLRVLVSLNPKTPRN
jgi:hypothetical protein